MGVMGKKRGEGGGKAEFCQSDQTTSGHVYMSVCLCTDGDAARDVPHSELAWLWMNLTYIALTYPR